MTANERANALGNLRLAVTAFARQLDAAEHVSPSGLEELKGAVDEVRLRIWSVLMAENSHDFRGFLERHRLRRAAEIVRGLVNDVDAGTMRLGHHEAAELAAALTDLAQRLEKIPKLI